MPNQLALFCFLFAAVCLLVVFLDCRLNAVFTHLSIQKTRIQIDGSERRENEAKPTECFSTLQTLNISVRSILIDPDALLELSKNCHQELSGKLKLAIDERDFEKFGVSWKIEENIEIWLYRDNPKKDYWQFFDPAKENRSHILPRFLLYSFGNVFLPADIPRFLHLWERSRKVECKNYSFSREARDQRRYIPLGSIVDIARFRDSLYQFGIWGFLNGGTLLGWYRECSIISHTLDIDFAVKVDEFKDDFLQFLKTNPPYLRLKKKIGLKNDSMELNVKTKEYGTSIDLFLMYDDGESSWVAGTDRMTLNKFKYTYPRITDFCSADLLDHAFLIPCEVEKLLEAEYGTNWRMDHPTRLFSWHSSHKNVKRVGRWPSKIRAQVYQVFTDAPITRKSKYPKDLKEQKNRTDWLSLNAI